MSTRFAVTELVMCREIAMSGIAGAIIVDARGLTRQTNISAAEMECFGQY